MRKKTIIAVILVCVLLVTGLLVSCNDKCTEHIDENGDNKCDYCGEDYSEEDEVEEISETLSIEE